MRNWAAAEGGQDPARSAAAAHRLGRRSCGLGWAEPAAASPPPGCRPRRDVSAPPPAPPSGRRPATRDLTRTRAEVRQSLGMVARTPSPRLLQTSPELEGG